jgi:ankyrin repeat protein
MPLLDLPIETLTQIAECVEEERDLSSLVQINHIFHDLFNDLLYRKNIASGSSALFWAAEKGEESTTRLLIRLGIDINTVRRFEHRSRFATISFSWTALHIAARNFKIQILKILIEAGADLEVKNHRGWTPLFIENNPREYEQFTLPAVKLLLDAGADPEARDPQGLTPLFHALVAGHENTAREIAQQLGDKLPNAVLDSRSGLQAIHCAARFGLIHTVRYLVDRGIYVDTRDVQERTALHHILLAGVQKGYGDGYGLGISKIRIPEPDESIEMVLLLLSLGANPELAIPSTSWEPYSARQIGLLNKDERVREIFENRPADNLSKVEHSVPESPPAFTQLEILVQQETPPDDSCSLSQVGRLFKKLSVSTEPDIQVPKPSRVHRGVIDIQLESRKKHV